MEVLLAVFLSVIAEIVVNTVMSTLCYIASKKKIDTLGMYTASPAGSFGVISYPCVGFVHTSS